MSNTPPQSYAEILNIIPSADLSTLQLLSEDLKKDKEHYLPEDYSLLLIMVSKRLMELRLTHHA